MYVKQKQTGQMGYLPDNQFDPNLYEKISDPTLTTQLDSAYKQQQAQTITQPQTTQQQTTPQTITGHTLQEHQAALNAARAAGDKASEADILSNYEKEYQYQKDTGAIGTSSPQAKAKEAVDLKNKMMTDLKTKAQAVKDIIEMGKSGKLVGKQYETALGQAASDFNKQALFAKEDKVAGSALTAVELAQLAGGLIGIDSRTQGYIDKIIGKQPAPEPKIKESEDVIAQKMDYILTGKPPSGGMQQSKTGNFLTNAPGDIKNILNAITGTPREAINTVKQMEQGPGGIFSEGGYDPLQRLLQTAKMSIAPEVGYAQNINRDIGQPLQEGDIVGRASENFNQRPVSTILDLLPILGMGKSVLGGKSVPKVPSAIEQPNMAQRVVRSATDVISGGGSKEYIARAARNAGALPENQVLLQEGILSHPSATGKITATSKSMEKYGSQIAEVYKNANPILANNLKTKLYAELPNYPKVEIDKLLPYIEKYGNFDLTSGDTKIRASGFWEAAKKMEEKPPKITNKLNSPQYYEDMSKDVARAMRQVLADANPAVKSLNATYAALADYMYNVLKNPQGVAGGGGIFNIIGKAAKVSGDTGLNVLYKTLGLMK